MEDVQLCIKNQQVHTYVHYYNYNLAQAISKKQHTKFYFGEGDLLFIMHCLVGLVQELQKYGISKAGYRSEDVYLSPEGYVKVYLLDVEEDNKHSCYFTVMSEREKLGEYLLAPEQLLGVSRWELEAKFDQYKADLYAIGLLMVELITLDQAKFYYNYELL
jgi:hypothetical protein